MTRIPYAVPNAESYQPLRQLQIPCRTCHQSMAVNLTESDFEDGNGMRQASISKTVACPNCSTMNTRYFSWENEFGDDRPFTAVETTLLGIGDDLNADDDEALWEAETLQQENLEMDGVRQIGSDESWLELAWNLNHRVAFLTLYIAEGDTPVLMLTASSKRIDESTPAWRSRGCLDRSKGKFPQMRLNGFMRVSMRTSSGNKRMTSGRQWYETRRT